MLPITAVYYFALVGMSAVSVACWRYQYMSSSDQVVLLMYHIVFLLNMPFCTLFHAVCTCSNCFKLCASYTAFVAVGTALHQQLQLGGKLLVAL